MQDLSNNKVNFKDMKNELRVNFPFHTTTGVRNSFCDGQYPELLVVLTVFTVSNDSGAIFL